MATWRRGADAGDGRGVPVALYSVRWCGWNEHVSCTWNPIRPKWICRNGILCDIQLFNTCCDTWFDSDRMNRIWTECERSLIRIYLFFTFDKREVRLDEEPLCRVVNTVMGYEVYRAPECKLLRKRQKKKPTHRICTGNAQRRCVHERSLLAESPKTLRNP